MAVTIQGPHVLANEFNKVTWFVSNSLRSEPQASTEIFGCVWEPEQTLGKCASAEAPYLINLMYWNTD